MTKIRSLKEKTYVKDEIIRKYDHEKVFHTSLYQCEFNIIELRWVKVKQTNTLEGIVTVFSKKNSLI